jgi:hypothetical protein
MHETITNAGDPFFPHKTGLSRVPKALGRGVLHALPNYSDHAVCVTTVLEHEPRDRNAVQQEQANSATSKIQC